MMWHGLCCATALLSAHGGYAFLIRTPPGLPGHVPAMARAGRPAMVEGAPLTPAVVQLDVSDMVQEPAPTMPVLDGVSIIAGTAIGGGFLALPSVTAPMGVGPAVVLMLLVWAFLATTGIAYAEAASMSLDGGSEDLGDGTGSVSVASITERTFGERAAYACSLAFAAQMLAVVTAQVVKAGEILQQITGLPYAPGCLLASIIVGGFTLRAPPRVVESANTALTAALTLGFFALVASTLAAAFFGASAASPALASVWARLQYADWSLLLPGRGVTWAAPIFLNLLCFGQAIPLVVERMAPPARPTVGPDSPTPLAERAAAMRRTRKAVLIGSAIPLVLSTLWIVVTSSVLPPAADSAMDPVLALIASAPPVAIPVTVMAGGAIGTTLIASYLTIGQFIADFLCLVTGYCSPRDQRVARLISVGLPVAVACGGPTLYLPLLSFAGAFPTTFLYGLLPPLAALVLRRDASRDAPPAGSSAGTAAPPLVRWLPGGRAPLVVAGLVAIALLLTNLAGVLAPVLAAVLAALR